jgi:hypothetical protein
MLGPEAHNLRHNVTLQRAPKRQPCRYQHLSVRFTAKSTIDVNVDKVPCFASLDSEETRPWCLTLAPYSGRAVHDDP